MHKPKKKSRKNAKKTSKPSKSKSKKPAKVTKKAKVKVKIKAKAKTKAPVEAKPAAKVRTVDVTTTTPVAERKTSGNGRIKVLVSLPPDLVERLDNRVRSLGTNRSEEIQSAIESSLKG